MSWTAQQVAITGGTINNVQITGLPAPGNPGDAATKGYVDSAIAAIPPSAPPSTPIANSLAGDVPLNNTANYFDGPSVAQGASGTWFASGTVTVTDSSIARIFAKLWDGTTVIASAEQRIDTAAGVYCLSLSGFIASPVGNIRISCRDVTNTTGKILFNDTSNSKDSTITAYRIA
jgi:hypothetical protein